MISIRKSLLQLLFSGSYMKRWNDKLRPMELVEVDKQAHKMMTAWVLYMRSARDLDPAARLDLGRQVVEGGVYDYLFRLVITDIKPPVFYRIKDNPEHFRLLSRWVLEQLEPKLAPLGRSFVGSMAEYLSVSGNTTPARRILAAAHLFASYSEFTLIKSVNQLDEDLADIERSFIDGLRELEDVPGVSDLLDPDSALGRFSRLCGQLRYQKRWSQTPRIPETSVLGHLFIVAAFSWFFSLEVGACEARRQNNFFAGLFHDLPELLTRDIISPVKRSSEEIAELIREYEEMELERRVLGPLVRGGHTDIAERLGFYLGLEAGSEFTAVVREQGRVRAVSSRELAERYNSDDLDPKDGELLKVCDNLAAFIEAYTAVKNGIASDQLHEAQWRIRKHYRARPMEAGIHVAALMADFDQRSVRDDRGTASCAFFPPPAA